MAISITRALPWIWLAVSAPIFGQTLTLSPDGGALPSATVGIAYNQIIAVSGGTVPYAWTFTSSPSLTGSGLTFAIGGAGNSTLTLSGTPTAAAAGSYTLTVNSIDSTTPVPRGSGNKTFTLVIGSGVSISTGAMPNGVQGVAYSPITLQATGGTGTGYTYAVSSGSLPTGLGLANGVISGTPTTGGTFQFTIRVTDSGGNQGFKDFTIIVTSSLTITTVSLPSGIVGVAYSTTLTASGGGTKTWGATGLPGGLTIGTTTGTIGGTPTASGSFDVNVTVTDGTPVSKSFTLVIAPALSITTSSLPAGTQGTAYSALVEAAGGTGSGRTWTASGLPTGLSIVPASGAITGTPTVSGTFTVTFTVADTTGSANKQLSLTIASGASTLTITTTALPAGSVGAAYSAAVDASGGSGTRTWSASGLPGGLGINSATGVISGTPTVAFSSTVTVSVQDTAGGNASKQLGLTISTGLTITTDFLPAGAQGVAYSAALQATGGSGTRNWTVTNLPSGLGVNSATGVISGTPTANGSFTLSVSVTDGALSASKQLALAIAGGLTITTAALPSGSAGVFYIATVEANGGSGTRTWSATGLPAGLTINASNGQISGTPTTAGSSQVNVSVTDATGTAQKTLALVISGGTLTISTVTLASGTVGVAYSTSLQGTGGTGNYTWSATGLPGGLSIVQNTGVITGTPTAAGTSTVTIGLSDGNTSTTKQFTLAVAAALNITTTALPSGSVGVPYTTQLQASGAGSSVTWVLSGGTQLPAGLQLNSASGVINGTPTAAGTTTFTVQLTDTTANTTTSKQFSITISQGLTITTQVLPGGTLGVPYNATVEAAGGSGAAKTWSATGLPAGLSMVAASGVITGTPTAAATATVTVSVSDGTNSANRVFSLSIASGLTIVTAILPSASVGGSYLVTMQAAGGSGNYSWTATNLPSGLLIASNTGVISGSPQAAGLFTGISITVSDGVNAPVSKQFSLTVATGISIVTQAVPNGAVGSAYSTQLQGTGTTQALLWRVTAGALPPGLTLTGGTGVIAGTPLPRTGGNYSFVVEASDGAATATRNFTVTILEVLTTTLPQITGQPIQLIASVSSGLLWSLAPGSAVLPPGMTLQSSGVLSGLPATPGTYTFAVIVTWQGLSATQSYTINTGGSGSTISITTLALPGASVGTIYSASLTATGGSGSYLWQLLSGTLPPGLALQASGVIAGTPTDAGTYNFVARVSDAQNGQLGDQRGFTIVVASGSSGTLNITNTSLNSATVNAPYSVTLAATGGTAPYVWTVTAGQLPFGVGLTPVTGLLSGTPLVPGSYSFTVRVTDATAAFATRQLTLVVGSGITITTQTLPGGSPGAGYNATLAATGGTSTGYNWTVISGSLPAGISLIPQTGVLAGAPVAAGSFTFTVQVADSSGATATRQFTITIGTALSITTTSLPNGSTNVPYSQVLSAAGGAQPLSWSIANGLLPPGLQLNPVTGQVTGTPTVGGPYTFTVQVRDAGGATATRVFGMLVTEGLSVSTATLPAAVEGLAYTQTLSVTGGTAPYVWTLAVGSLPPGLTLNPTGTISGTPTSPANYSFILQVSDAGQQSVTKALTLIVNPRTAFVIATPLVLPGASVQNAYTARFQAQGGAPPYVWSLAPSSTLPGGLTLDPDGNLTGVPTAAGIFSFAVRVTDSQGQSTSQTFSLSVIIALGITTQSLPAATVGSDYFVALGASGGQSGGYTWSGSNLPPGLSMDSSGVLSGVPSAAGTFSFQVQVTEASGASATASLTLLVRLPAAPTATISGLGDVVEPAQQPRINVTLGSAYPVPVTGTVTMTFTPDASIPADDPAVVFANGRRVAPFTVEAGSTQARFADGGILQTGTVAGTIELVVRYEGAGQDLTPSPAPRLVARVNRAVPVIRSVRARRVTGGLEVELIGFATSRELRQAVFRFTPIPGSALQTTELTVPLTDGARTWYQSEQSRQFGSQFTLTQQFSVAGDTNAIASVTVTMTNEQGTSSAVSANF